MFANAFHFIQSRKSDQSVHETIPSQDFNPCPENLQSESIDDTSHTAKLPDVSTDLNGIPRKADESGDKCSSSDSNQTGSRRRSSRIQLKESRVRAESKIKAEKEQQVKSGSSMSFSLVLSLIFVTLTS